VVGTCDPIVVIVEIDLDEVMLVSVVVVGLAVVVARPSVAVCGVSVVEGLSDQVVGEGVVRGESVKRTAIHVHNVHRCRPCKFKMKPCRVFPWVFF